MIASLLAGWLLAAIGHAAAPVPAKDTFHVLCYHDVADDARGAAADTFSVHRLVEHFEFLKVEGWSVISVDDLRAARDGVRPLPPKAVLLTFDDGYEAFATRVLPLLEAYRYPAVFAFVTSWLETANDAAIDYGGTPLPRSHFVSPEELRRIAASPWVEIASHSHDLHRALLANREGNTLPAGIVRLYDAARDRYEDDTQFRERIRADLEQSAQLLEKMTGRRPRTLAWPYGRYNAEGVLAAQSAGFDVLLGLEPGVARVDRLQEVPRHYPARDLDAGGLARMLSAERSPGPHRYAVVSLAALAADTHAATEDRLGRTIESVRGLGLSAVHLEAFADDDGDGRPDAAFVAGAARPLRRDALGRAAWQLRTRAGVDIVLRLPLRTTAAPDWNALGRHVVFDAVMFTDFVAGRDDPTLLATALAVLRRHQPAAKLLLRVPAHPDDCDGWERLGAHLFFLPDDREATSRAWQTLPAARGRLVVPLVVASSDPGDTWLARGFPHFGIESAPEAATGPWATSLSARVDPFAFAP